MTIPAHLENKDVKNCHLLYVIIKEPENIIKAVHLCVCDIWNKRTKVSTKPILAMSKRPVLVSISGTFKSDRFLFEHDRVNNCQHLGGMWGANS